MDKSQLEALEAEWKTSPQPTVGLPERLPLAAVTLMPEVFQCRDMFDPETGTTQEGLAHIAGMTTTLKGSRSRDLDPLRMIRVGSRDILIDGHHRLSAYRAAKRPDAPVEFYRDSPMSALVNVGAENQKTKLTLTAADRSEWAWKLVRTGLYSKAEERMASGVSDGTIGKMRSTLKALQAKGEPIPASWRMVKLHEFGGEEGANEQAKKWALMLTQHIGPPATFKTTGKRYMLRDAIIKWAGPRLAEELTLMLAEELDITARVEEQVQIAVEELGEEGLEQRIRNEAEDRLIREGRIPQPDF